MPIETGSKIAVVGAGYVGLVTATLFARYGNTVYLVEKDPEKKAFIKKGQVSFFEPGLPVLLRSVLAQKKLILVDTIPEALDQFPTVLFSCVGTPSLDDGSVDLTAVWQVVRDVGMAVQKDLIFVHKSTVPVGVSRQTSEMLEAVRKRRNLDIAIDVASNPEFLSEGTAISNFVTPRRVICGTPSLWARKVLRELYAPFLTSDDQFIAVDFESAELSKYAANFMLASRLTCMNQLGLLADKVGADIKAIEKCVGTDARIGSEFLATGIGYGGSCLPKDVKALAMMGKQYNQPMTLAHEVDQVNTAQLDHFVAMIVKQFGPELAGKRVGIWGMAFKPGTDDLRHAPSIAFVEAMLKHKVEIYAYDPHARPAIVLPLDTPIVYTKTPREVLVKSDFLVILTEWEEFKLFGAQEFALLTDKTVFDGRNCFNPTELISAGIAYFCLGRKVYVKQSRSNITQTSVESIKQKNI